jgi:hypothetical protein
MPNSYQPHDDVQHLPACVVVRPLATPLPSDVLRFYGKVRVRPDGCWEWLGAKSKGGRRNKNNSVYGSFHYHGRTVRAHRFSCEALGNMGELPPGYDRAHLCHNTLCVNWEHIDYQPAEINQNDRWERARSI